jgi:hypothetical protein
MNNNYFTVLFKSLKFLFHGLVLPFPPACFFITLFSQTSRISCIPDNPLYPLPCFVAQGPFLIMYFFSVASIKNHYSTTVIISLNRISFDEAPIMTLNCPGSTTHCILLLSIFNSLGVMIKEISFASPAFKNIR